MDGFLVGPHTAAEVGESGPSVNCGYFSPVAMLVSFLGGVEDMKRLIALAPALLLAGCIMYGDEPNYTMTVRGNYQEVSDCSYEAVQRAAAVEIHHKADLPSKKTSSLVFGVDDVQNARLDFTDAGGGNTKVNARMAHLVAKAS
ncbi:hypothetical protein C9R18_25885, partial [Salmonella enterica subsp. enterica serovar Enteritidis]|nr:hypothetical protein [Salmonella enterica subsp. enterica serovar Enteritidis]